MFCSWHSLIHWKILLFWPNNEPSRIRKKTQSLLKKAEGAVGPDEGQVSKWQAVYVTHKTPWSSSSSLETEADIKYSQDFTRGNLISREHVLILFSLQVDLCFRKLLYRVSTERREVERLRSSSHSLSASGKRRALWQTPPASDRINTSWSSLFHPSDFKSRPASP